MKRCIELADESYRGGDLPFGAVVSCGGKTVAEAHNTGHHDITGHAEINALKRAREIQPCLDLSSCTLYTNFEPCAMCSFVIRDMGVGRVVYAVPSPHLGGHSRWNILQEPVANETFLSAHRAAAPDVTGGVLREEAQEIFGALEWKMHLS